MHPKFPPPWQLTGTGYMLLYWFNKDFVRAQGNIPAFLSEKFKGGLGAVMLVNYHQSNCGPYDELLFIPGKFLWQGKTLNSITKIYVSSQASIDGGRENWAIPKEKAAFEFGTDDSVRVHHPDGTQIFSADFTPWGPSLPVNTKLLPFPLVQKRSEQIVYTNFFGKGWGKLCKVRSVTVNNRFFPDISSTKPLIALKIDPFKITFPIPSIQKES